METILYYDNTRRLMFGKYQGEPVWSIIKSDPTYIIWCINNIDNFKLTDKELDYLKYINKKQIYQINSMPMWYKRKYGYYRNYKRENLGGGYGCGDRNLYG